MGAIREFTKKFKITCEWCGKAVYRKKSNARTCSDSCRVKLNRSEKLKRYNEQNKELKRFKKKEKRFKSQEERVKTFQEEKKRFNVQDKKLKRLNEREKRYRQMCDDGITLEQYKRIKELSKLQWERKFAGNWWLFYDTLNYEDKLLGDLMHRFEYELRQSPKEFPIKKMI